MGYRVSQQSRKRMSFIHYKGLRLNLMKRTSAKVLKRHKREMIESGTLDVGQLIVPIEYDVLKIHKNGALVKYFYVIYIYE